MRVLFSQPRSPQDHVNPSFGPATAPAPSPIYQGTYCNPFPAPCYYINAIMWLMHIALQLLLLVPVGTWYPDIVMVVTIIVIMLNPEQMLHLLQSKVTCYGP